MRFMNWTQYEARFPAEARLITSEKENSKFLADMYSKIVNGEDISPNMRKALANWTDQTSTAIAPENIPERGDLIRRTLKIYEVEQVESRRGVVNTYRFEKTPEGWQGRIETNSAEVEDVAAEWGVVFEPNQKRSISPPWEVDVEAEVVWVADRAPFLILGGRQVRIEPRGGDKSSPITKKADRQFSAGFPDWKKSLGL